ncbi:MAG: rhodanese-like domain-containing protein [Chitinophagaceae bacterium]
MNLQIIPGRTKAKTAAFDVAVKLLLNGNTPVINVSEALTAFNQAIFLDAREFPEYQVSHLYNARHVGAKKFKPGTIADLSLTQPLIVYCSIGKRSDTVTQQLISAGYQDVRNLYGGIFEWVNYGHPVYDHHDQLTEAVHAYNSIWGKWLEKGIKIYD